MRALTVVPGQAGSPAVSEVPEPAAGDGARRVPLGRFAEALVRRPDDVKVVIGLGLPS